MASDDGQLVLVLNSGSSSVKFAVVEPTSGGRRLQGQGERLGSADARLLVDGPDGQVQESVPGASHEQVVARVLQIVSGGGADARRHPLLGAGHRVVHGGDRFAASTMVTPDVLSAIRSFSHLAPLHNPFNLAGIEAVAAVLPGLAQVAVFDTAFHQSMPPHAYRYAVPEAWYTDHAVRRYGFHGTSHRFVAGQTASLLGRPLGELRLVTAHLGNGCSAAAIRDGRSVDTTMGLTPLEGLVMGTRSGDVDPGLFEYLGERTGMDAVALTHVLNFASGLEGLSGVGSDMRNVTAAASQGDLRARLALDVFSYRLAKTIAGLVVPLGRIDAVVFTGGIGEHSVEVRRLVLSQLGFLGLAEDEAANAAHGRATAGRVSRPGAVVALVVPTDEELMIARDTAEVIRSG